MVFKRIFFRRPKKSIFYLFKKYFAFVKAISCDIVSELKQFLPNDLNAFDKTTPDGGRKSDFSRHWGKNFMTGNTGIGRNFTGPDF